MVILLLAAIDKYNSEFNMSYSKFQKEAGKYSKWRDKKGLPYLEYEKVDEIIRDKWIKEKKYTELIAYVLESWDSGNCDYFSDTIAKHLIENKKNRFYKLLWKGILRNRIDSLWNHFDEDISIQKILNTSIKGFNQFSSKESNIRRVAWARIYVLEGFDKYIQGLKILKEKIEYESVYKQREIIEMLSKTKPLPTTDKRKIDEGLFWELITRNREKSENQFEFIDNLYLQLQTFKPNEMRKFDKFISVKMNELNHWDIWALAYIVRGGCGDDAFDDFRAWVISKGERVFQLVKTLEIEKIKNIFNADPQLEDLLYITERAYEFKTNEMMKPFRTKYKEIEGKQWKESELKTKYTLMYKIFD